MEVATVTASVHDGASLLSAGDADAIALIAEGRPPVRYRQLRQGCDRVRAILGDTRQLVAIAADGSLESIECLLAVFAAGHAAMLTAPDRPDAGLAAFRPPWRCRRGDDGWTLERLHDDAVELHPALAVLLSTSGSTGAGKFVRLSYDNLLSNAESIRSYLGLTAQDRGLLTLPVHYSYGLSVLTSHLASGAAVLVSSRSFTDPRLWGFFNEHGGTNLSGVPHNYRLLETLPELPTLPRLRFMTQAGGRLDADAVVRFAARAEKQGARFFVMYGQTEASPRMAYLPPHLARAHPDCIGVAVPGGQLRLVDAHGADIDGVGIEGELVYRGRNVMMGYATSLADLSAPPGPQELHTGDLARRNAQGLYAITGRASRFLKLFGLRISLDEIERRLEAEGVPSVCTGNDDELVVVTPQAGDARALQSRVAALAGLPAHAVRIVEVNELPRLPSGKPDQVAVGRLAFPARAPAPRTGSATRSPGGVARTSPDSPDVPASVLGVYTRLFPDATVDDDSSFDRLGGDSLSYVEASLALQDLIPALPGHWPTLTVRQLQALCTPRQTLVQVETSIVLRALAMVTVVSNHFGWFSWRGGAYVLLMVAGYNLARFALRHTIRTASVRPILALAAGIAVPTLLTVWLRSARSGDFDPLPLLMLGNFMPPAERQTLYWFLEALTQLLLIMALLLAPAGVRRVVERSPWPCALGLLGVGTLLANLVPLAWDASALRQWVPHMLLWMLALGWVIQASQTARQKLAATALVVVAPLWAGRHVYQPDDGFPDWMVWMWAGGLALLWLRAVPMPRVLSVPSHWIAGASLFIFLFHHDARRWLRALGVDAPLGVQVAAGIALGIVAWMAWERLLKALRPAWGRLRSRRPAARA